MAGEMPEAPNRGNDPQRKLAFVGVDLPSKDGAKVLVLGRKGADPTRQLGSPDTHFGPLDQLEDPKRMAVVGARSIVLDLEALKTELADRLQHAEAKFVAARRGRLQETALGQHREALEDVPRQLPVRLTDRLGRLDRCTSAHDRQPAKECSLWVAKQFIAPRD